MRAWANALYGNRERALKDMTHGIDLDPSADWAREERVNLLIHLGEFKHLKDLSRAERESLAQHISLQAQILSEQGLYEKAERTLAPAFEILPGPELLAQRGMIRGLRGDLERARKDFEEALSGDEKCSAAHYGIGWCLEQSGRYVEAETRYDRAVRLAPLAPDVRYGHINGAAGLPIVTVCSRP